MVMELETCSSVFDDLSRKVFGKPNEPRTMIASLNQVLNSWTTDGVHDPEVFEGVLKTVFGNDKRFFGAPSGPVSGYGRGVVASCIAHPVEPSKSGNTRFRNFLLHGFIHSLLRFGETLGLEKSRDQYLQWVSALPQKCTFPRVRLVRERLRLHEVPSDGSTNSQRDSSHHEMVDQAAEAQFAL
ncbi:hypothetical protein AYL99_11669 [Fonsecaea erecta]|uniref:Uncharacterized protein n=1 Tax=Fonsecaea erecta TaxID=1367422 RepID=A0A178Z366_9EURO|nr:hypothetical protein AYL99_11669 [Fonsecaea erecta]OAP54134.1 hypothetical protein AYL99_11669 [Fonsecaea erecta]